MQEHFAQTHALYPDSIQQTQDTQSQASKNDIKKRTHKKVENSAHETVVQRASLQSLQFVVRSPLTPIQTKVRHWYFKPSIFALTPSTFIWRLPFEWTDSICQKQRFVEMWDWFQILCMHMVTEMRPFFGLHFLVFVLFFRKLVDCCLFFLSKYKNVIWSSFQHDVVLTLICSCRVIFYKRRRNKKPLLLVFLPCFFFLL